VVVVTYRPISTSHPLCQMQINPTNAARPAQLSVRVGSEICIEESKIPPMMRQRIESRLTRVNPDKQQRERLGLPSYDIPDRVSLVKSVRTPLGSELCVPRGALDIVRFAADKSNVELCFSSVAVTNGVGPRSLDDLPVDLRDYQKEAIKTLIQRVQGYVTLPCGGGKTVLGAGAVYASGESALILVHTHELMDQWEATFRNLYGVKVRRAGAPWSALKPGEVAIATVQKLHRVGWNARRLYSSAGVVLLDECHHAPASTFRELLSAIPARYRWGLTATPERPDGWGFLLPMVMGPQVYRMTTSDLVDRGFLVEPMILPVRTGTSVAAADNRTGRINMSRAVTQLSEDRKRYELIMELAMIAAQHGRRVLVLVPRVKLAHTIANDLRIERINAAAITGSVDKGYRGKLMRGFREGGLQVAIATQLADEGLDVPMLDMLIIASAGRAAGRAIQRIGRAMRPSPGKARPVVVDLIDNGPFRSQWRAREKAYLRELKVDVPAPIRAEDAPALLTRILGGDMALKKV